MPKFKTNKKYNDLQENRKINSRSNALKVLAKAKALEAQQKTIQVYDEITKSIRFVKIQNSSSI